MIVALVLFSTSAMANPVVTWFENEKNKTIKYQKESWEKGKVQFAQTKQSILNLFKGKKNATQD